MLHSSYRRLCPVTLPFAGRQKYMHSFDLGNPVMAEGYEDYLAPVLQLCGTARATAGIAHMTVDEKIIAAGMSQRRPRPHVDGCFMPKALAWGHQPPWLHNSNNIVGDTYRRMPVIVASSIAGCRAWRGEIDAQPDDSGDLSHAQHLLGGGEILPPNVGYLLSPDCVHESMIFDVITQRTFLRIALPVDYVY